MKLICPECGEQIVARGFAKCPGCYEDLPEEFKLTQREKELDDLDDDLERKLQVIRDFDPGNGSAPSPGMF